MCLRRGGSSILILKFCEGSEPDVDADGQPCGRVGQYERDVRARPTFNLSAFPPNTRVRYNCFISFSNLLGSPGYMLDPPERTMCL